MEQRCDNVLSRGVDLDDHVEKHKLFRLLEARAAQRAETLEQQMALAKGSLRIRYEGESRAGRRAGVLHPAEWTQNARKTDEAWVQLRFEYAGRSFAVQHQVRTIVSEQFAVPDDLHRILTAVGSDVLERCAAKARAQLETSLRERVEVQYLGVAVKKGYEADPAK